MNFTDDQDALERIDAIIVDEYNSQPQRPYFGMSGANHECNRKKWFDFRWVSEVEIDAKKARLFDSGHRGEAYLISQFEQADIGFEPFDDNGKQFEFSDLAHHLVGHCDAITYRLPPLGTPAIWEAKITDEKLFKKLAKLIDKDKSTALLEWNALYYGQAMLYCKYSGIERHWLVVGTPGVRELLQVETEYDEQYANDIVSRSAAIITTVDGFQLDRISESASWWQCKQTCDHAEVCHYGAEMQKHCRTCQWASPDIANGGWYCSRHSEYVDTDRQRIGCDKYKVISNGM